MKIFMFLLATARIVLAGELVVVTPFDNDSNGFGIGYPFVQSFSDGDFGIEPRMEVAQNGQVIKYIYRDVKPGMYRICLDADGNPFGCTEILMETHVKVEKNGSQMVFLYEPRNQAIALPADIANALKKHTKGMLELSARYHGTKKSFPQVRSMPGRPGELAAWIHYLRPDAEYTVKIADVVRNEGSLDIKVVYEKNFKVGDGVSNVHPDPKPGYGEQVGAGQPATRPESNPESGGKPQPKSEGRSR